MKTEQEIRENLTAKSEADAAFRAQLIADPKATVESELNVSVPEGINLHVHEETPTSVHLVLPPAGGRLSPGEMQSVAGGHAGQHEDPNYHSQSNW